MYRMGDTEVEELRKVIESKSLFRLGDPAAGHLQEVVRFEQEWAEATGVQHALCLSGGGTAALTCALAALQIGPGDEVIVPAYTWMATACAVLAVGAIPVLAEVDETLGLDPHDVERKLSPDVRAIIPVHMLGRPADLDSLCSIARKHSLKLVEDACQAAGASYRGKRVGSWGDISAFSFNHFKIISCGEGGAVVTDDPTLHERALIYHDIGIDFRSQQLTMPSFLGMQLRASELMGAVLRIQLQRLDGILADLRRIKHRIEGELSDVPGLNLAPANDPAGDGATAVTFQFQDEALARTFSAAQAMGSFLAIDSGKHVYTSWDALLHHRVGHHPEMNPFNFPRNQRLRTTMSADSCPRTLDILSRTVHLPLHPDWTDEEITVRIDSCRKAAEKR